MEECPFGIGLTLMSMEPYSYEYLRYVIENMLVNGAKSQQSEGVIY